MKNYICDFETIIGETTRVWLSGIYCHETDFFTWGNSITHFINFIKHNEGVYYFHNLKFDGEFIFYWLLNNGFEYNINLTNKLIENEFNALIDDSNTFYSITIQFKNHSVTIHDSLKLIPFAVADIPSKFNFNIEKLGLNYNKKVALFDVIEGKDVKYLLHDCKIVGMALDIFKKEKMSKMTIASNALHYFKRMFKSKEYKKLFPKITKSEYMDIKPSYKGGISYVNPKFKNKLIKKGVSYDVHSAYPFHMMDKPLPIGKPIKFTGKPVFDELNPVFIVTIKCDFKVKENFFPFIQLKNSFTKFGNTEYISDSENEHPTLTLTNVDYERFLKHYNITNVEYFGGYKFRAKKGLFDEYIQHWFKVKHDNDGVNKGLYTLAKLLLNALYGKYGARIVNFRKMPILIGNKIGYKKYAEEHTDGEYLPLASFVTSYQRDYLTENIQNNFDRFIYCDTDSIHLIGEEIPKLNIGDELGQWGCEGVFYNAKYIRSKTYMHFKNNKKYLKCCGLPSKLHCKVNINNFNVGLQVHGKLRPTHVEGGIVLEETTFQIKEK